MAEPSASLKEVNTAPIGGVLLSGNNTYWQFMGQCTECGHCREACQSLSCAGLNLGQIAKHLLAAQRAAQAELGAAAAAATAATPAATAATSAADATAATSATDAAASAASPSTPAQEQTQAALARALANDANLTQAVRGCFFCTSCQQTCFAHNDVCELVYAARVDYQRAGLIPRAAWSSVLVDEEWHIFTAYRAIWGIGYADLTRHIASDYGPAQTGFDVAFFPGCSLTAYAPELTREVFATLEEVGGKTTMIDKCCGSSLKSAGFYDRAEALCARIAQEIEITGACEVVCVCPGCKNALIAATKAQGINVQVTTVSEYLLAHNFKPKRNYSGHALCFSKSCQDRDGSCLRATRELLDATEEDTTVFHGCCGAGGAVSAYDQSRQAQQIDTKLSFAKDGETVVTMCPTCTYTYAFHLMGAPRPIENKHYLELLFENSFDWEKNFSQLNSMWTGPYGPWLASVF